MFRNDNERIDSLESKVKNSHCVNAEVIKTYQEVNEKTKDVKLGSVVLSKEHCQNLRRNGSKYCQECSEKHNDKR